ncbi:hypothetical protein [Ensifer adhaerens]|uniref:Uncharacterized protein n=1 Tax=Ensifer adhaerens TaxID=106592 RepID=A0A9Q9DBW6_ENSAD|nr:hypothetical protein [Ensifer adhaerens]USJ25556.1 hypothetical protein NE863_24040 [Ensifer adhaerens]
MSRLRERLARWIERRLPQPRLREGATNRPRRLVKRIIVFGRMPNPTFDYYLAARLEAQEMPPYQVVDIRSGETTALEAEGTFVILCRYASPSVLRWIEINAEHLAGVGLFVDDDIPAVVTGNDADFFYRLFLWYRALWPLRRLNRHLDIVWASTANLAANLACARAVVLPPAPPLALSQAARSDRERQSQPGSEILIGYHATGVHLEEHHFLRPVIAEILRERPQVRFEVFADRRAKSIWRGLECVEIREPMAWIEYLADANTQKIDIMLVPLAPSRVNDCRAATKRIDIARYQAAAVFSEGAAYGHSNEGTELRLPYNASLWRETILRLVDDSELRETVAAATHQAVMQLAWAAVPGLESLKPDKESNFAL